MVLSNFINILRDNGAKVDKKGQSIVLDEPRSCNGFPPVLISYEKKNKFAVYKQDYAVCQRNGVNHECIVKSAFIDSRYPDVFKGCDYLIIYEKRGIIHLIYIECKDQASDEDYKKQLLYSCLFIDYVIEVMKHKGISCKPAQVLEHFYILKKTAIPEKPLLGVSSKTEDVTTFHPFDKGLPRFSGKSIKIISNPGGCKDPLVIPLKRLIEWV